MNTIPGGSVPPRPDMPVQYKPSPDATEVKQTTLKIVLADYLDEKLPADTVVELHRDGRFIPVADAIRTSPHLVENRSVGLQVAIVLLPSLLLLLARGRQAFWLQLGVVFVALLVALNLRSQPLSRGRSSQVLLRQFWHWSYRKVTLGSLAALEVVMLLLGVWSSHRVSQTAGIIEAAQQDPDPCNARHLDQEQIRKYATNAHRQKLAELENQCSAREAAARQQVRAQQKAEQCQRVVEAMKNKTPVPPADIEGEPQGATLIRISQRKLELQDLIRGKDQLPCVEQGSWSILVEAVRTSPIWATLRQVPQFKNEMRAELEKSKLDPSVVPAFKQSIETMASESLKQRTAANLEPGTQLCQLFISVTTENSPACKALEGRYQALKVQDAQATKIKAAQEEQQEKAKEARCKSITAQFQACNRRCDTLLFNGSDDAAIQCEENCGRTFPTKDCP
jgi:hypothetical protein